MKRTVTVKLQPSKEQEKIDFSTTEKEAYHTFKSWFGDSAVQQLARKNAEIWGSFFSLNKKKKAGKLPEWFKPKPPKFIKDSKRKLFIIPLRNDQYRVNGNIIELRRLGKFGRLRIQFKGRIHLKGKQGRLEIVYDEVKRKWYAHTSYTVKEKLEDKDWVKIPREPRGKLSAGIDLGVNNLMAVYLESGESFLVNGRPLKSIEFYWQERIANYQSKINKSGCKKSRKLKRMHEKAKLQAKHYINTAVRQTVKRLHELGVSRIVVGHPKEIAREPNKGKKQNFILSHVWRFNYVLKRLREVAGEYGIQVLLVNEVFTSKTCPLCGQRHKGARFVRGLFKCRRGACNEC